MVGVSECLLLLVILLVSVALLVNRAPKGFPPGPWGLPHVGYIPFLGKNPYETLRQLAWKYGEVFSVPLGCHRMVVLNNLKDIKEAWKDDAFNDRPPLDIYKAMAGAGTDQIHGLVFTSGNDWSEQRKFSTRQLKGLGFGSTSMESHIAREAKVACDMLDKQAGGIVDMCGTRFFDLPIMNSLWSIVTSERFDQEDSRLKKLIADLMSAFAVQPLTGMVYHAAHIYKMFPTLTGWNRMTKAMGNVNNFALDTIREHQETMQEGNPRDFTDVYIDEIKKTTDPKSSFYGEKGVRSLNATVMDLFGAGTEATASALLWIFYFLATYPDIQKRIQKEIDDVIGSDPASPPSISHRKSLCYLEAFILEAMRYPAYAPAGDLHATTTDIEFRGFHIPKGTIVMANIYSVLKDPRYWDKPEEFKPERFLDENGQLTRQDAYLIFGSGKRSCIGEVLARNELFLFTSMLLHRFNFALPGDEQPSLENCSYGILIYPPPYRLMVTCRKQ